MQPHNTSMNYQVTCVCGHVFTVTAEQAGKHTACPACQRALIPVVSQPASTPPAAQAEATKRCPACGEVILAIARKCKHCGEYLDGQKPSVAAPNPTPPEPDNTLPIFSVSVSQWDNFFRYIVCITIVLIISAVVLFVPAFRRVAPAVIFGAIALMGFMAYFFFLSAKSSKCFIRPARIETETGIFSKQMDSLELYRVVDLELDQGFIQRLLGIGSIKIKSNDPSNPELVLYQVPQARKIYKYLQEQVPIAQKARGVVLMS